MLLCRWRRKSKDELGQYELRHVSCVSPVRYLKGEFFYLTVCIKTAVLVSYLICYQCTRLNVKSKKTLLQALPTDSQNLRFWIVGINMKHEVMQNVHYSKQSRGKTLNCTYTYLTRVKVFGSKISETYDLFSFLLFTLKCTLIPISIVVLKIIFSFLILLIKT